MKNHATRNRHPFAELLLCASILLLGSSTPLIPQQQDPLFLDLTYAEALERAADESKDLYILYSSDRCPSCQYLKKYVLSDDRVARVLREEFVSIRLQPTDPAYLEVQDRWQLVGLPTHVLLSTSEELTHTFIGTGGSKPEGSIAFMLRHLHLALSDSMSYRALKSKFDAGSASTPELRTLADILQNLALNYPEEHYPTIFGATNGVVRAYFASLSDADLLDMERIEDLTTFIYRADDPVVTRLINAADAWRETCGDSVVVHTLTTILMNDASTRIVDPPLTEEEVARLTDLIISIATTFGDEHRRQIYTILFEAATTAERKISACGALALFMKLPSLKESTTLAKMLAEFDKVFEVLVYKECAL